MKNFSVKIFSRMGVATRPMVPAAKRMVTGTQPWSVFLRFLIGVLFLVGILGEARSENSFSKGDFSDSSLSGVIKRVAEKPGANYIVSHKVWSRAVEGESGDAPISQVMSRIAEKAKAGFLEDSGIFLFSQKDGFREFSSFPLLQGIPNPSPISLDFSEADIRDLCALVSKKSGFNIIPEKSVRGSLSLRLNDIPWPLALHHAAAVLGFECRVQGNSVFVGDKRKIEFMLPPTFPEDKSGKKISIQFRDTDIRDIFGIISKHFSCDFITGKSVRGNVTIGLRDVGEGEAAHIVAASNGFACKKIQNIWFLNDGRILQESEKTLNFPVTPKSDQGISLDFRDAGVRLILDIIAKKSGLKIGVSPGVTGTITLRLMERAPIDAVRFITGSQGWEMKSDGNTVLIWVAGEESVAPEFNLMQQ